jgi:hypothetical protein
MCVQKPGNNSTQQLRMTRMAVLGFKQGPGHPPLVTPLVTPLITPLVTLLVTPVVNPLVTPLWSQLVDRKGRSD